MVSAEGARARGRYFQRGLQCWSDYYTARRTGNHVGMGLACGLCGDGRGWLSLAAALAAGLPPS